MARAKKAVTPITRETVPYWTAEISAAKKREKDYREEGQKVIEIYEGKKKDAIPFNILFSNIETLLPALYSSVPRPSVDRRFKDGDPLGKASAMAGERMLEFLLDTNIEGYETYDEAMNVAVLDALLPGRGVTSIKYDAEIGELPTDSIDDDAPAGEDVAGDEEDAEEATPYKKSELVCLDARSWNRIYFGYAKKWSKVPWMAYEEHIDYEESCRLFGKDMADKLDYAEDADEEEDGKKGKDDSKGLRQTACVWQIWDKEGGKKLRYVSDQCQEFLKVEEDPLGLTGFFNCPRPVQFIAKANDLTPTAPYFLYENQAKELNELTRRISRIAKAIKAKGVYDSSLGDDIKTLVEADDNELVPADKDSSLAAEKGLQNAIWFMPVEQLVNVLQQLYQARERCKQVIYEITGIADIMRGVSQASETLGAQQIKQSWGTLRLKRQQKEVMRYARDLLRMMLEVACSKFSEETWAKMTGLPYLTTEQNQQAQKMAQVLQMQMQQMQAMVPPAQPGQPPAQPQVPPQLAQLQQQFQQVQGELQKPVWGQILEMLKDNMQRAYRIDIETNSTLEPEAAEDQKNIADLMNAIGQYLNGVGPLVTQGIMPFQAAQAMLLAIVRRYKFGAEIEDQIKAMQPPKDQGDGAKTAQAAQAHQADMAAKAADLQAKQADNQAKQQDNALKAQVAERQAQMEMQRMDREAQYAAQEHAFKMEELAGKERLSKVVTESKIRIAQQTAAAKEREASQPVAA